MEFNEKLQELRKSRGLTQEELAEALYVSRTAISKWESGRGYPSIDSLKAIAKFFSVTIDDLLSGEKIIFIAERENKSNVQNICDLLFGFVDLMSITLIILPLYPNPVDNYIYSVPLFAYSGLSTASRVVCWVMFISLIMSGAVKVLLNQVKIEKGRKLITSVSVVCSIAAIFFLAITRQGYAVSIAFFLFVLKGVLLFKKSDLS
ncbi:MAG: helix-turn-helix transcriptional regulator [Oscillospiraceae bacterium]|nr:helix-turn-helix transcriptional regulator [Oscillospiraceae bacterium]